MGVALLRRRAAAKSRCISALAGTGLDRCDALPASRGADLHVLGQPPVLPAQRRLPYGFPSDKPGARAQLESGRGRYGVPRTRRRERPCPDVAPTGGDPASPRSLRLDNGALCWDTMSDRVFTWRIAVDGAETSAVFEPAPLDRRGTVFVCAHGAGSHMHDRN